MSSNGGNRHCILFTGHRIDAASRAANKAVVLLGARGYNSDYPVERYYRDIKGLEIYEGTSHIQRLIIGRDLVGPDER